MKYLKQAILFGLALALAHPAGAEANTCSDTAQQLVKTSFQSGLVTTLVASGTGKTPATTKAGAAFKGVGIASMLARDYCKCRADGGSKPGCSGQAVGINLLCLGAYAGLLPNPNNPFSLLSFVYPPLGVPLNAAYQLIVMPDNPYCEPGGYTGPLKCCKYTPAQSFCHTAFGSSAPINCEGNPSQPLADSFGPCMKPANGIGCLCTHIAECATPDPNDPFAANHRRAAAMNASGAAFAAGSVGAAPASGGAPDCGLDAVSFIGCRGWSTLLEDGEPYKTYRELLDEPMDQALQQGLVDTLAATAAFRAFAGVPNGWERFDYVASRTWTESEITAYLDGADPEIELSTYLSACGLQLLQAGMPRRWELMAVPHPTEGETDKDPSLVWEDGCVLGDSPTISSVGAVAQANGRVVLTLEVDDPEAAFAEFPGGIVRVDWGDDSVGHALMEVESPDSVLHDYGTTGTYTVSVTYLNSAGLDAEATTTVVVSDAAPLGAAPGSRAIEIPLMVDSVAESGVQVWATAVGSDEEFYVGLATGDGSTLLQPMFGADEPFPIYGDHSLRQLILRPVAPAAADGESFSFDGIDIYPYASDETEPPAANFVPTLDDIQSPPGAAAFEDPARGIVLPHAPGEAFIIELPCDGVGCDDAPTPGDVTGDDKSSVSDSICVILTVLWAAEAVPGPIPTCLASGNPEDADLDCSGDWNVSDVQLSVYYALELPIPSEVDSDGDTIADACPL